MGGTGSGRKPGIPRKSAELEKAGITAYALGMSYEEVAVVMQFHKNAKNAIQKFDRYRKAYPDFNDELEKAKIQKKLHARQHSFRTAYPTDKDGNWQKGDTAMGIFLHKTLFGLREGPNLSDVANAIAPLIQFSVREPVGNEKTATGTPGAYFDPQKENQEG